MVPLSSDFGQFVRVVKFPLKFPISVHGTAVRLLRLTGLGGP
jgi:hypothetical protein